MYLAIFAITITLYVYGFIVNFMYLFPKCCCAVNWPLIIAQFLEYCLYIALIAVYGGTLQELGQIDM